MPPATIPRDAGPTPPPSWPNGFDFEAAVDALIAGLATQRFEIVFPRRFAVLLKLLNMLPYDAYFALVRRMTGK